MPEHIPTVTIVAGQKNPRTRGSSQRRSASLVVFVVALLFIGGTMAWAGIQNSDESATTVGESLKELRLGYFANVTHALPVIGVNRGTYQQELGGISLKTQIFNSGPTAVEALNAGAIDAAYIGPNPSINAYAKSQGTALRVISGATSGGAQLVVRPEITSADQLRGASLASPQLGNTQDVALRTWLKNQGLPIGSEADQVKINPTENARTLKLFQSGQVDGAWLPEPWASRLVLEAGAKVLVDEEELWPQGAFPTTLLVVSQDFLENRPEAVQALLRAQLASADWVAANPGEVITALDQGLQAAAGVELSPEVLKRALDHLRFTADPLASAFPTLQASAVAAGLSQDADLAGLFDLRLLNQVLAQRGEEKITTSGGGQE